MPEVTATNQEGDFSKALKAAIKKAEESANQADALIRWKLDEVSGEHGSIVGLKNLTVKISYEV